MIFLDMDGVLADFDSKVIELVGKSLHEFPTSQDGWDAIDEHQDLFDILDKMPDADALVNGVDDLAVHYGHRVGVLTAIPKLGRMHWAKDHKKDWIKRHYPEHFQLLENFYIGPWAEHKQLHYREGDILIDDNKMNIEQWSSRGGKAIFHTSAKQSLEELEAHLKTLL